MDNNNINLATFQFDTTKLEQNIDKLQTKMFELRKEQQSYANQSKEVQKAINEVTKSQLALAAAGQESSEEFAENKKMLDDLNASEQQLFKNQQNTAAAIGRVRAEVTSTTKQLQSYMTAEGTFNTLTDAGNKALETQVTNINQARASNTELLRVRNQLNPAISEEAALITKLNERLDQNNDFIKNNASAYEKTKINIGNYADSIKTAFKESGLLAGITSALPAPLQRAAIGFKSVQDTVSDVKNAYKDYREAAEEVKQAQETYNELTQIASGATEAAAVAQEAATAIGFRYAAGTATQTELEAANTAATIANAAATDALTASTEAQVVVTNASSASLKLFRIALISTGIGAIVVVLGSLIAFLTTTQSGIDKLTAVTAPLKAIFSALMGVLSELGGLLVDTFSNPKKALNDLYEFVKGNLINRFTAFGEILEGIINLDFKQVANGFGQAVTGVENLSDKVADAGAKTTAFFAKAAADGAKIAAITKQIGEEQLAYNAAQVAFNDAIDEQLLISKDTSKTFAERAAAAREIIRLSEENGQKERAILQLELQRLKIEQEIRGVKNLTNEDRQAEIDLLEKIDAAEDRGLNARLEQSRVLAGLEKERQAQAKAASEEAIKRAKEQQEAAIKAMQVELDFYLETQGDKKRSMAEQLAIDKETMRQSLAINKAEFDAKKKTRREFELEALKIQNEFAAKQVEATIQNADIELELYLLNNQRKIDANKFFSDELYNQELDRINRTSKAEKDNLELQKNEKLISLEEYNLAVAQIDENQRQQNEAARLERQAAEKERIDGDLANKVIADGEAFEYSLALQTEQIDRQYALEKEQAIANGLDMEQFEKAQAEKRKAVEKSVQDNKLELASSTFGSLASILGKESAAGKAAAIAQATIDTYKAATSAYSSLSGIPVVGPVLGAIAAGAAIAAGIANVKKIVSVKPASVDTGGVKKPSYARGGLITGSGSGMSDSIEANVSNGESIMTARATTMFPTLLSDINQLGGGVRFDNNSSPTILQNQLSSQANSAQMSEVIAEAVMIGAQRGTQKGAADGITNLSDNRQIMSDAKF